MASSRKVKKEWECLSIKNLCCCLAVMVSILLFEGCKKQDVPQPVTPESDVPVEGKMSMNTDKEFSSSYGTLPWRTMLQLVEARIATAKYRNIHKAIEDGYQDINVVVQNMGFHYMKSTLADAVFEIRKPELLVYNNSERGVPELVAVEYAVPISITPEKAPEGFTGDLDVWERNTSFGLWLLHAWVWRYNPAGVFHDTNPRIQLH